MSGVAPTAPSPLDDERRMARFDVGKLTVMLDGGEAKSKRKQELKKVVENDPVFRKEDKWFLGRSEEYRRGLERNAHIIRRVVELQLSPEEASTFANIVGELLPISGLHHAMFIPTLQGQATQEQQEKWLAKALRYDIIGTYAQTEAGHGSYLRGVETTATYDKSTQEFVLNTPTITATKWWPGGLGKTATHCVLMARLITDKDHGVHPFILQLRDLKTHEPLPGIEVGDIGPKFAWNTIDNGFLRLHNVRIPRDQMLMRYAKVSPDGQYTRPPHAKVAYGTMIFVRASMINDSFSALAKGVTIAIRYSAVRRQGYLMGTKAANQTGPEMKVLDYGTQQAALLPLLASAYSLHFTGQYMLQLYKEVTAQIKAGDFTQLPELHATSAGLKAFCTWMSAYGIEECRQRCGGHGFLRSSALPDLFAATVPACTYEGDNLVLLQQTARYLFKALKGFQLGKAELTGNIAYLKLASKIDNDSCPVASAADLLKPEVQLAIYRHKAVRAILTVGMKLEEELKQRGNFPETWNWMMSDFKVVVKAHTYLIMLEAFTRAVAATQDAAIRAVLKRLCDLFALYNLEQDISTVLVDGYFAGTHADWLNHKVKELLREVRVDAIPLVDAFDFSDRTLNNSTLGRFDGHVYDALYESAQREPLNASAIPEGYKYISALLKKKAKL